MAAGIKVREKEGDKGTPTRVFSKKQESKVASDLAGTRNLNSGATDWQKGDVSTKDFLIECKTKVKPSDSIKINKSWIEKNVQESVFMGKKHSALAFNFGPGEPNYYIIDQPLFQVLIEYIKNSEEI